MPDLGNHAVLVDRHEVIRMILGFLAVASGLPAAWVFREPMRVLRTSRPSPNASLDTTLPPDWSLYGVTDRVVIVVAIGRVDGASGSAQSDDFEKSVKNLCLSPIPSCAKKMAIFVIVALTDFQIDGILTSRDCARMNGPRSSGHLPRLR
jgi:hypothetical protein